MYVMAKAVLLCQEAIFLCQLMEEMEEDQWHGVQQQTGNVVLVASQPTKHINICQQTETSVK